MATTPTGSTSVEKLEAARTRLVLERPFLGALTLRLPLQAADPSWCPTTRTDARTLFYNPAYVETLSLEQVQFALCAQALHCALLHFDRRGHREPERWDRACRHAVDLILADEGMTPAPESLIDPAYAGMTADEIYPLLPESAPGATDGASAEADGASASARAGDAAPTPPDAAERQALARQWKQRLAGVAQQALHAGRLGAGMERVVEAVLKPALPWRSVLARYMNGLARNDFSYARPSNRRGEPAIFPSLRSSQLDLVVAVDVSGSIDADEFNAFMHEVDALKAQVSARVTLLTCDSEITDDSPWVFEPWDHLDLPEAVIGSGATDFRPVFDWIALQDRPPDLLVYFTDAAGTFPPAGPGYPVLWLVQGRRPVPWGERIQLN